MRILGRVLEITFALKNDDDHDEHIAVVVVVDEKGG